MNKGFLGERLPPSLYALSIVIFFALVVVMAHSDSPYSNFVICVPPLVYLLFGRWAGVATLALPIGMLLISAIIIKSVPLIDSALVGKFADSYLLSLAYQTTVDRLYSSDGTASLEFGAARFFPVYFSLVFLVHLVFLQLLRRRSGKWLPVLNLSVPLLSVAWVISVQGRPPGLENNLYAWAALFLIWMPGFRRYGRPSTFLSSLPLLLHYIVLATFFITSGGTLIFLLIYAILPIAGYWFPAYRRLGEFWNPSRLPRIPPMARSRA